MDFKISFESLDIFMILGLHFCSFTLIHGFGKILNAQITTLKR
jgi:hypothetical protein